MLRDSMLRPAVFPLDMRQLHHTVAILLMLGGVLLAIAAVVAIFLPARAGTVHLNELHLSLASPIAQTIGLLISFLLVATGALALYTRRRTPYPPERRVRSFSVISIVLGVILLMSGGVYLARLILGA